MEHSRKKGSSVQICTGPSTPFLLGVDGPVDAIPLGNRRAGRRARRSAWAVSASSDGISGRRRDAHSASTGPSIACIDGSLSFSPRFCLQMLQDGAFSLQVFDIDVSVDGASTGPSTPATRQTM